MTERKARPVTKGTTQITVLDHVIGCLDIGIGWNDSSCLDGRWPEIRAGGFGEYRRPFRRRFSRKDWDRYFDLMEWSGCHWLRHSISVSDWKPSGRKRAGNQNSRTTFAFNSEKMQQHYLVLDQAEKRGMKVLLANWNMGSDWPDKTGTEFHHPENEGAFAEALAALIYHLKRERKYDCVWALSLWNEPDNRESYSGPKANYPDSFWPLYKIVDCHLRDLGIRDEILLFGPDTTTGGRPQHITKMLKEHGSNLDIVADHDYAAFRGKAMFRSVVSYEWLMANLRDIYNRRVPFVISEFGNYGSGSGPVNDDKLVYKGALSTTAYLIRMINKGVAGLARWEFSIYGNQWRNFGALTNADEAYLFRPYAPVYYPHAITARYIKPGWDVREVWVDNDCNTVLVSALTSKEDELTLIVLNEDTTAQLACLTLELQSPVSQLHHLVMTASITNAIIRCEDIPLDIKNISIALPPQSVTVLTTLPLGNLERPMELALKRASWDEFYDMLNRKLHLIRKQVSNVIIVKGKG